MTQSHTTHPPVPVRLTWPLSMTVTITWSHVAVNSSTQSITAWSSYSVRGAPWSAANQLHGQRTGAFSWHPMLTSFQEDQPILARPYPELRTWMVMRSGVISVFTSHSPAPTCDQHAYQPPPPSSPPQPLLTRHIHHLWITRPPSMRSYNAWSEWKLPLRGRITYRHCRQTKLPNFLYMPNTTSWRMMRRANNNNNSYGASEIILRHLWQYNNSSKQFNMIHHSLQQ